MLSNPLDTVTAKELFTPLSPMKASGDSLTPLSEELAGWERYQACKADAIPTGITALDRVLDGGLQDELYVLAGLPGFGKTALALQVAESAAMKGNDVIFFSFELSKRKIISRLLSHLSYSLDTDRRLYASQCENGYQLQGVLQDAYIRAKKAFGEVCSLLYVLDGSEPSRPAYTAKMIMETVDRFIKDTGRIPVLMVDKLQRIPRSELIGDSSVDQIEHASYTMSLIPKFLKAPTVVLSDLTKQGELKGSSNIGHDASVVAFLKLNGLDFNAREDKRAEALKANPRSVDLVIDKNRVGECGIVHLDYHAPLHTFTDAKGW